MKIDFYNPIKDIVSVDGKEMSSYDFKNMCFKNGWEGTLYRFVQTEMAFEEYILKSFSDLNVVAERLYVSDGKRTQDKSCPKAGEVNERTKRKSAHVRRRGFGTSSSKVTARKDEHNLTPAS